MARATLLEVVGVDVGRVRYREMLVDKITYHVEEVLIVAVDVEAALGIRFQLFLRCSWLGYPPGGSGLEWCRTWTSMDSILLVHSRLL